MKYFLTGGTGFLGNVLAKKLVTQGHSVVALVRNPAKATKLIQLGVQVVQGDVTDKASMREGMRGCDGVYHVAAWYKVGAKDATEAQRINVEGTRHVLELMQELHIPKGIYTSTLAINSDTKGKIHDETFHFTGIHLSTYDRTKAEAHDLAKGFIRQGLPLVIVMPGLIYGPDGTSMSDEGLILYLKKKLPVMPAKAAYCWGHVDDIADGHILAMKKGATGSTYIIAGPPHTFVEALQMAKKITGIRLPPIVPPWMLKMSAAVVSLIENFIPLPEMYRSEAQRVQAGVTYLGDNSKAKRELGYQPRPLEEGLRETLTYELKKIQDAKRSK